MRDMIIIRKHSYFEKIVIFIIVRNMIIAFLNCFCILVKDNNGIYYYYFTYFRIKFKKCINQFY